MFQRAGWSAPGCSVVREGIRGRVPLLPRGLAIIPAFTHHCRLADRRRCPDGVSMAGPHHLLRSRVGHDTSAAARLSGGQGWNGPARTDKGDYHDHGNHHDHRRAPDRQQPARLSRKVRHGFGKKATYERIGVAWENEDKSVYVKLYGTQVVNQGFTLYRVEDNDKAGG